LEDLHYFLLKNMSRTVQSNIFPKHSHQESNPRLMLRDSA